MLIILFLTLAALGGWWYGFRQGKRYGAHRALLRLRAELGLDL
jgi:hypothetical protein